MCSIDIGSCYLVASHFPCSWAWEGKCFKHTESMRHVQAGYMVTS